MLEQEKKNPSYINVPHTRDQHSQVGDMIGFYFLYRNISIITLKT